VFATGLEIGGVNASGCKPECRRNPKAIAWANFARHGCHRCTGNGFAHVSAYS
jgi:hypothetical protein